MKYKVLLVDDDNESLLRSLGNSFSAESYEVVVAENVEQAIEKSEASEIDLLLIKLDLPTEQGWEAIDEITEENPFLPIIVVTRRPELRYLAEATGACALVEEPVDVPAVLKTIHELLAEPVQRRMERVFNRTTDFRRAASRRGDFCETRNGSPGLVTIAPRRNYSEDKQVNQREGAPQKQT